MLPAGWSVRRIREATQIHTKTIAKFRRQWLTAQSDPPVSAGEISSVDTPNPFAEPVLDTQSDSHVSTEVLAEPLRAPTQSGQLSELLDVIAALLEIAPNGIRPLGMAEAGRKPRLHRLRQLRAPLPPHAATVFANFLFAPDEPAWAGSQAHTCQA